MWRRARPADLWRDPAPPHHQRTHFMAGDRSQHRLGIALVVAAAVAWLSSPTS
jgi:hypothetical protein